MTFEGNSIVFASNVGATKEAGELDYAGKTGGFTLAIGTAAAAFAASLVGYLLALGGH